MSLESFWDFSLRLYHKPQVSETCLTLQNVYGFDVNLLLFACWYGRRHGLMSSALLADALEFSTQWSSEVVKPLRHARTWMKGALAQPQTLTSQMTGATELREKIKAAELRSEQLQQQVLEQLAKDSLGTQAPESGRADSPDRHNNAIAHNLQKVREASAVTLTPALAGLLQVLHENATSV